MNDFQLPVLQTVVQSYRLVLDNFAVYVRLIWFPFLFYCFDGIFSNKAEAWFSGDVDGEPLALGVSFLALILMVPSITAWHRLVILGTDNQISRIRYSFRVQEWGYFWRASLLFSFVSVFIVLVFLSFGFFVDDELFQSLESDQVGIVDSIIEVMILAIGIFLCAGFLLIFPAVAVGKPISFSAAIKLCKGNWWRIWAIYLMAILPEILLEQIFYSAEIAGLGCDLGGLINVFNLAARVSGFIFFMISVGAISLSYKALMENRSHVLTKNSE